MQIPSWLSGLTGAQQFANNPANGFQPTFGDGLQGIGHSMMQHYRGDPLGPPKAGTEGGQPTLTQVLNGLGTSIKGDPGLGQPQVMPMAPPVAPGPVASAGPSIAGAALAPATPWGQGQNLPPEALAALAALGL